LKFSLWEVIGDVLVIITGVKIFDEAHAFDMSLEDASGGAIFNCVDQVMEVGNANSNLQYDISYHIIVCFLAGTTYVFT
jgi:hypothetical protein